jgi:hypothetical protein
MLNLYEVRKELSKEKYARQRVVDPTFYRVSEVLERNELNEVMLIRMLSDICSHLHRTQKDLCSYLIKYGMIEAREHMTKVDFEKEYDCQWIGKEK